MWTKPVHMRSKQTLNLIEKNNNIETENLRNNVAEK